MIQFYINIELKKKEKKKARKHINRLFYLQDQSLIPSLQRLQLLLDSHQHHPAIPLETAHSPLTAETLNKCESDTCCQPTKIIMLLLSKMNLFLRNSQRVLFSFGNKHSMGEVLKLALLYEQKSTIATEEETARLKGKPMTFVKQLCEVCFIYANNNLHRLFLLCH